jgi:hypothetical protein
MKTIRHWSKFYLFVEHRLKKIINIILTILFIYNTVGFIVVQPFISFYLKHLGSEEARNVLNNESVELIVLQKEDILRKKLIYERIDSKEFRLNDDIYDIVKEVDKDSLIFFYCINDKREKDVEKNFRKNIEENTANKKHNNNYRVSINKIISEPIEFLILEKQHPAATKLNAYYTGLHSQVWKNVITPPPKDSLA